MDRLSHSSQDPTRDTLKDINKHVEGNESKKRSSLIDDWLDVGIEGCDLGVQDQKSESYQQGNADADCLDKSLVHLGFVDILAAYLFTDKYWAWDLKTERKHKEEGASIHNDYLSSRFSNR